MSKTILLKSTSLDLIEKGAEGLSSLLKEAKEEEIKDKTVSFLVGFGSALTSVGLPTEVVDQVLSELKIKVLGQLNVDKYQI